MLPSLKERRQSANITQAEAAKAIGVDQTAISQWETGKCDPKIPNLLQLAKLYGCTVDQLLTPVDDTNKKEEG